MSETGAWASLVFVGLMILLGIGAFCMWAYNIVKLVHAAGFGILEAMRAYGIIFPPLGVAMGFI